MVNMNLFGHDPIHDFRMTGRLNKPHIQTTLKEIHDLYQKKKILTPLVGGLKESPYDKKLSLSKSKTISKKNLSEEKLKSDSKKVNLESLVKEFSMEIMFLIGNLTSDEINLIKKNYPNNITDKIITSAIEKRYPDIKKGGKKIKKPKKTKKKKQIKTKKKAKKSKNKITKKKYKIRAGMGQPERNNFKRKYPKWIPRGEGTNEKYLHPVTKQPYNIREALRLAKEMEIEESKEIANIQEGIEKEVVEQLAAEVADESKKIEELNKLLDISDDELNKKSSEDLKLILDQLKKLDEELPDDLPEEIIDKLEEKSEFIPKLIDRKIATEKKAKQDEELEQKRQTEEAELEAQEAKAKEDEDDAPKVEDYLKLQEIKADEEQAKANEAYFKQQAEETEAEERGNITSEELSNEIIKLFAKIGLNLCDESVLSNDLIKVQTEILEKFLETKDVATKKVMPSIDEKLEEGFKKYLESKQKAFYDKKTSTTSELNEELKKIVKEDEDKRYIINNGAVLTTSDLKKNIIGSATSIIDSASGGFGVSENIYPDTEVGNMDVTFRYKTEKQGKKSYHIQFKKKDKKYTVSINGYLPYTNKFSTLRTGKGRPVSSIKFDTGEFEIDPNEKNNENNKLVAYVAYFNALKVLLKKIENCAYFDWNYLSYDRDFLNEFIKEYHTKAVGDLLQELTSILKFGGFSGHKIEIPEYKSGSQIFTYGDILRLFLASDRPSAVRFMLFKLHLDPEFVNQLAYGGFYGPVNNPNRFFIA